MNPLDRLFADARRTGRPYVGKPFKLGSWEIRTEPKPEWGGYFYEVTHDAVYRNQWHDRGMMRGQVRERIR